MPTTAEPALRFRYSVACDRCGRRGPWDWLEPEAQRQALHAGFHKTVTRPDEWFCPDCVLKLTSLSPKS